MCFSADARLTSAYGLAMCQYVEIVHENPKKKTIHFGGIKDQVNSERYIEMIDDL